MRLEKLQQVLDEQSPIRIKPDSLIFLVKRKLQDHYALLNRRDLTKEILLHFEAYGFLNPVIIQCDKEMSIIDVCRKVARERNGRTVLQLAPKTSHQSNGFVEAVHGHIQDSHDATRHKLRRTLEYYFQQFHLPFHLQFVTLDLFSQDSQCEPTAEPHSNICLELHCITFVHVW